MTGLAAGFFTALGLGAAFFIGFFTGLGLGAVFAALTGTFGVLAEDLALAFFTAGAFATCAAAFFAATGASTFAAGFFPTAGPFGSGAALTGLVSTLTAGFRFCRNGLGGLCLSLRNGHNLSLFFLFLFRFRLGLDLSQFAWLIVETRNRQILLLPLLLPLRGA